MEVLGVTTLLVAVIWLALEFEGVVNIISFDPPVESSNFAQIVGGIGSLVLTFGLVFLYKQQTAIQHRQERWMSASHRPELEFTSWVADNNQLSFELSNLGNGVAKNLAVTITVNKYPSSISGSEISAITPLYRKNPFARSLEEQTSNSEAIEFKSDPIPDFQDELFGEEIQGKFHEVIQHFGENNVESVRFKITIEYELIREESEEICVWSGTVDVKDDLYLDAAIKNSTPDWGEIEIELPPENV
ncbi:hypothetical protein [Halorubrum sp. CBA1229]|uniref:hypothetical protein n=1 Tax=Halorubrum sp. CBA1229 TaxID=1853699 RepID=UPI0011CD83A1|nr:hypothetical protein [Halorubrum sp. CBA1229]QKY18640.1 hypothetical protein Hrr1229_017165 [Halorubrum sp. CBA1229]